MTSRSYDSIENRSIRLNILQCFMLHSSLFPRESLVISHHDPTVVSLVRSWENFRDVVVWLREECIVTCNYGISNLEVDLWYLRKTQCRRSARKPIETGGKGPEKLLLTVVIQALLDAQIKRPCDVNIWLVDLPPDNTRCTHAVHICSDYAEKYLLSLDTEVENFIGLSHGCIHSILCGIKKDSTFSVESVFSIE